MSIFRKIKENGVPLRTVHTIMIVLMALIAFVLLFETFRFSMVFTDVSTATDKYIELQKDANELMNASDYLTQEVQNFTVTGERIHLDNYFEEAKQNKRRENALNKMKSITGESRAYELLNTAMNDSLELMQTEYYAMKLTAIAFEIKHVPQEIEDVSLSAQAEALSSEKKAELAQSIVHNSLYHRKKDSIRRNMELCLQELETQTHNAHDEADKKLDRQLNTIRVLIFVQLGAIVLILVMTSFLIISPILSGVHMIKKDEQLPVKGSYEFRYLAKTYNKMYEAFKISIKSLNYEASHDKLTGLYNRAGYDVLSESIDLKTTTVLLVDVDKFKEINDNHGHAVGDKVLRKVADVLKKTFRSEDYICRIGGDEFVVFMIHVGEDLRELISLKVQQINSALADTSDSLPFVSTSIGVAFGHDEQDLSSLLKHADAALYLVKGSGRQGCCFYEAQ